MSVLVPTLVVPELHAPRVSSSTAQGDLTISSGGSVHVSPGLSDALSVSTTSDGTRTIVDAKTPYISIGSRIRVGVEAADVKANASTQSTQQAWSASAGSYMRATQNTMRAGTGETYETGTRITTSALASTLSNTSTRVAMTSTGDVSYRASSHVLSVPDTDGSGIDGVDDAITITESDITMHFDLDIQGSLDTVSGTNKVLQIADPNVVLASNATTDTDISSGDTGITIDTVPATTADLPYVNQFTDLNDTPSLVAADGSVDVQAAQKTGLFANSVVYMVNGGMRQAGKRSAESRRTEPAWQFRGGAVRLARIVPSIDTPGVVFRYTMDLRVTDEGNFEVGRIKQRYVYNESTGTYASDGPAQFALLQECLV